MSSSWGAATASPMAPVTTVPIPSAATTVGASSPSDAGACGGGGAGGSGTVHVSCSLYRLPAMAGGSMGGDISQLVSPPLPPARAAPAAAAAAASSLACLHRGLDHGATEGKERALRAAFSFRQASVADDDDDDGNDNDVVKINISGNTNNDSNTKKHHHHHQQQQKHQVDVKQLRPAGAAGQNLRQQATTTGAPSSDIGACDSRGWSTTNTTTTTATPSAVATTTATPSAVTTTTATPSAVTTTTGLVIDAGADNHLNNSDARSASSIIIGPTPAPRSACLLSTRGSVNGGGVSNTATATTTTTMTATTPTIVASCTNSTTPAGVVSVTTVCSSPSSRSRRATDEAEQSKCGDEYGLSSLSTVTATAQAHELLSNLDGPDQRLLLGLATAATLASPSPNSTVELASMSEREASTEATAFTAATTTTATSTTAAAATTTTTTTTATSTTVTTSATTTTATTNTTAAVVAAAGASSLVRGLADGAPPRHHDETSRAHPSERSETCGVVAESHVDDLDKPASTMPPLPPSTTLLDEQIAGHRHGHGKTKLGLLRHADGSILKPLVPNDVRAKREHDFYLFMEQHRELCRARPAEYNNSSNNNDNNSNNNDNNSSSSNNNNNDKNNTDRHDGAGSQTVDNATCLCDDPILHQLIELTPRYLGVFETAYPDEEDTDQDIDQRDHDEAHDDLDDDALVSVESASQTAATSTAAAAVASGDAGAATKTITATAAAADAAGGSQQRPRRRQQQQQQKQQCHPTSHEVAYMKLADLCRDFGRPCIADVKIGRVVHDPEATADKIEQSVSKYPAQYDIGYRILGMRVFGDDGRCRVYDANFGLQQTPASVADAIKTFMDANPGCVRPIVGQLERIMAWFERQRRYAFYSSSILIVYDAIEPRAAVKLIDFAHVFPTDRPDDNYMFGLARLISDFRAAIPPPA